MTTNEMPGTANKLIIPQLAPLYAAVQNISWLAFRVTTGALLMPHGAQKLFGAFGGGGLEGTSKFFESVGYSAPDLFALLVGVVEFFGGLCIVLGLFTRPVAIAVAIFMAVAVQFHMGNGFFWVAKGYEYPFLWGMAALFFAVQGGGAYSLDRKLGREF
ncbi:DoxX family protein [Roseibium sp.]|uniref:DoxX family protein n=1 Tax=Roseibium sp. TaxID=1936156 RepID=UPI003D0B247F